MATLPSFGSLANVAASVTSGNFAANYATVATGGLNSISASLAGVTSLAGGAASAASAAAGNLTSGLTGAAGDALNSVTASAGTAASTALGSLTTSASTALGGLPGNASAAVDLLKSKAAGLAPPAILGMSGAVDAAKGIAGSAFGAITSSFKSFTPDIPQNLTSISIKNAEVQAAADVASGAANGALDAAKSAAGNAFRCSKKRSR